MSLNFAEAGIFPDYAKTVRKLEASMDIDVRDYPLVLNIIDEEAFDNSMEKVANFAEKTL